MPDNRHASAVVLGDRGVLIIGNSGTGKSSLAVSLIGRYRAAGSFARLVADDQIFLAATSGRAVATAPGSIAGLAEIFGVGPARMTFEAMAVIDLVVELLPGAAPRLCDATVELLPGVVVPLLSLAGRNTPGAVNAVAARLAGPPFGRTDR